MGAVKNSTYKMSVRMGRPKKSFKTGENRFTAATATDAVNPARRRIGILRGWFSFAVWGHKRGKSAKKVDFPRLRSILNFFDTLNASKIKLFARERFGRFFYTLLIYICVTSFWLWRRHSFMMRIFWFSACIFFTCNFNFKCLFQIIQGFYVISF